MQSIAKAPSRRQCFDGRRRYLPASCDWRHLYIPTNQATMAVQDATFLALYNVHRDYIPVPVRTTHFEEDSIESNKSFIQSTRKAMTSETARYLILNACPLQYAIEMIRFELDRLFVLYYATTPWARAGVCYPA
ncbi:hypothetical protein CBL_05943 [Carabus blaptoides fortunei]